MRIVIIAFALVVALFAAALLIALGTFCAPHAEDLAKSIEVGGRQRDYYLHLPRRRQGELPLLIVLHGGMQTPAGVERMSGMSDKADAEGFLVAYPRGIGRLPTWNAGNCCGAAQEQNVDDVAFVHALIGAIENDYRIDRRRVFATGISNGGMMAYRLACALGDEIAAIAPVEGAQNSDCQPSHAVSLIAFHGTADSRVPFDGGAPRTWLRSQRVDNSVANAMAFWAKRDGCKSAPEIESEKDLRIERYSSCDTGRGVALYAVLGGRHNWPGGFLSGNRVPTTDLIWSFFADHPKP